MIVTLTDGDNIFEIVNGDDRIHQTLSQESGEMIQTTQEAQLVRAEWDVAFPEHARRSLQFSYRVIFPQCASLEAAFLQSRQIPLQCPKGGVLVEEHGEGRITYEQAWIQGSVLFERRGVSNIFTFPIRATNPTISTPSLLAKMDIRYVANLFGITGLTGGGATNLDGYVTADVAAGFKALIRPTIGGVAQTQVFGLVADPDPGVTLENDDPAAGTLIVLPDDYNETTNAKIWIEQL